MPDPLEPVETHLIASLCPRWKTRTQVRAAISAGLAVAFTLTGSALYSITFYGIALIFLITCALSIFLVITCNPPISLGHNTLALRYGIKKRIQWDLVQEVELHPTGHYFEFSLKNGHSITFPTRVVENPAATLRQLQAKIAHSTAP